jgi:hypothetical protein
VTAKGYLEKNKKKVNNSGEGTGLGESGNTVTITDGTVSATGGDGKAGIGGDTVTIRGGTVNATGKLGGAGIGGNQNAKGGAITISGGYVVADGGYDTNTYVFGAGIGNGATSGVAAIADDDDTTFTTGADGNAVIVASSISDTSEQSEWSGLIFNGNDGAIYSADNSFTLTQDVTIPAGATLTVAEGQTLVVPAGTTLTIPTGAAVDLAEGATLKVNKKATMAAAEGSITGNGKIETYGESNGDNGGGNGSSNGGGAILLAAGAVAVAAVAGGVLWLYRQGLLPDFFNKAAKLSGVALDEAGNVLQNATILVQQLQEGQLVTVQTTTTGADGSYKITVPDGDYTITAQYTDPLTGETRTVELNVSENAAA